MNKLYINKHEFNYEILDNGIRLKDKSDDRIITNPEIFSIRYINLYKIEMFIYILVSIVSFGLWWVLGLILSSYTIIQILMNYRIILITSKGQFILKFNTFSEKENFINLLKVTNPEIFKISKWFNFKKDKKV